jgi:hypothetical protein
MGAVVVVEGLVGWGYGHAAAGGGGEASVGLCIGHDGCEELV